jgi:hypothetical protein
MPTEGQRWLEVGLPGAQTHLVLAHDYGSADEQPVGKLTEREARMPLRVHQEMQRMLPQLLVPPLWYTAYCLRHRGCLVHHTRHRWLRAPVRLLLRPHAPARHPLYARYRYE